ncbi:carotenoid biosynthesis protein [soil metagenome]
MKEYRLSVVLLISHIGALVFGLIGLLIMLPNPDLWNDDPRAVRVFNWSIENAGATHIILGAAAMFAFGVKALGWSKTTIFFTVSFGLSLASELVGTGTGWPFGNYEYTDFLGQKVFGQVPYTIPLSWFYMGLSSYLIGVALVRHFRLPYATLSGILAGGWLLTVWDLVLDPAMAHDSLQIKFWEWSETGPYFGMPIKNFVGWTLTALAFMAISRLLWRKEADTGRIPAIFPFAIYTVNTIFAMALSMNVDLWIPVVLSALLGLVPAWIAVNGKPPDLEGGSELRPE